MKIVVASVLFLLIVLLIAAVAIMGSYAVGSIAGERGLVLPRATDGFFETVLTGASIIGFVVIAGPFVFLFVIIPVVVLVIGVVDVVHAAFHDLYNTLYNTNKRWLVNHLSHCPKQQR